MFEIHSLKSELPCNDSIHSLRYMASVDNFHNNAEIPPTLSSTLSFQHAPFDVSLLLSGKSKVEERSQIDNVSKFPDIFIKSEYHDFL